MTKPDDRDDNDLNDLDLHAWQAPAPPKGLADAVIARATATDEAIAITKRGQTRRTLVTAAIACGGSIAAGLAVWLAVRPAPVRELDMTVVAAEPQHVVLDDSTVDLSPGATIQTERRGDTLRVVQSGTATWHVAANDHLEIDAGSNGAIEATGASLRVESTMNTQQALLVGGGVLSAAAIALVTATVYEGHVASKTTTTSGAIVSPGRTITLGGVDRVVDPKNEVVIDMGWDPKPLAVRGTADVALAVGDSATVYSTDGHALVELQSPCPFNGTMSNGKANMDAMATNTAMVFDLDVGAHAYSVTCNGKVLEGSVEVREDCRAANKCTGDEGQLLHIYNPTPGALEAPSVHIAAKLEPGAVLSIGDEKTKLDGEFTFELPYTAGQSLALRIDHQRFPTQFYVQHGAGGAATLPKQTPPTKSAPACSEMDCQANGYADKCCATFTKPDPATCNADGLTRAGTDATGSGDNVAALRDYAAAYACKPDKHAVDLAFMAACNNADVRSARVWWRKLSADDQERYVIMCKRRDITKQMLDAP
jgi:hypothetical protein